MNTYFENRSSITSNKRIIEAYFEESVKPAGALSKKLDALLSLLAALLQVLTSTTACRLLKTIGVALSLVGFIGVIGAMECGKLGLGAGFLIGALLLGVEYLCLRTKRQRS